MDSDSMWRTDLNGLRIDMGRLVRRQLKWSRLTMAEMWRCTKVDKKDIWEVKWARLLKRGKCREWILGCWSTQVKERPALFNWDREL